MTTTFGRGTFSGFGDIKDAKEADDDLSPEDVISSKIQQLSRNVLQIRQLVDNIGTTLDSEDLRQHVSQLQTETNALTKTTNMAIKEYTKSGPPDGNHTEWKVKQTLLRKNFHDVLTDYNELQKTAQRKQRETLRVALRKSAVMGPRDNGEAENEEHGSDMELDQIQITKAEVELEIVTDREQAIQQLETDIIGINEIFNELSNMINDQGEDIVVIEKNVEIAKINVEVAVDELDSAETNMCKLRRKQICLIVFLCLLVGSAIIIIVAVFA